jgi:hypothetical protein
MSSTISLSISAATSVTTSSREAKWLKTVRRETSAAAASSSTEKSVVRRCRMIAAAASSIARRVFAFSAARRSTGS